MLCVLPQNPVKRSPTTTKTPSELINARKVLFQTWTEKHPEDKDKEIFMDMQMSGMDVGVIPEKIYIPVPTGKVYIPLTMYTGSGGKGKHDRSVFAGYSESAFEKLAQKTMRGAR